MMGFSASWNTWQLEFSQWEIPRKVCLISDFTLENSPKYGEFHLFGVISDEVGNIFLKIVFFWLWGILGPKIRKCKLFHNWNFPTVRRFELQLFRYLENAYNHCTFYDNHYNMVHVSCNEWNDWYINSTYSIHQATTPQPRSGYIIATCRLWGQCSAY